MGSTQPMYDVPPTEQPIRLRGLKLSVVLDEFAPTHLDAWYATAFLGEEQVPAVVVRHTGDVGRRGLFGGRSEPVPERTGDVLGIVVERPGATAVWLPDKDRAALARDLSRADWRQFLPV